MISLIHIIAGLILLIYLMLICVFYISLNKLNYIYDNHITKLKKPKVSLIIAFRNEEQNLPSLIHDIKNQSYNLHEVLFINDHSTDQGFEIIKNQLKNNPILRLIDLDESHQGKKSALYYGAQQANGKILLFTDAGCRLNPYWAETMLNTIVLNNSQFVAGPVDFIERKGIFHGIQNLEFLSLIGSTAGGFAAGIPFMCNGANLAVNREIYFECVNKYGEKFTSGDDVFLLHKIKKQYKVSFCNNTNAIVKTLPQTNLKNFLQQRIRWASKAIGYQDTVSLLISLLLLATNLLLIAILILSIIDYRHLLMFSILFSIKALIDILFMSKVLKFFNKRYLIKYIALLQVFYPFYIVITGFMSIIIKPKWKGRKIS